VDLGRSGRLLALGFSSLVTFFHWLLTLMGRLCLGNWKMKHVSWFCSCTDNRFYFRRGELMVMFTRSRCTERLA
jgi:hypothetical protein